MALKSTRLSNSNILLISERNGNVLSNTEIVSKPVHLSACLLGLEEGSVSWSSMQPEVGKVRGVQSLPLSRKKLPVMVPEGESHRHYLPIL